MTKLIKESSKPIIVHYWDPEMGSEPPLGPFFQSLDTKHGEDLELVIMDSGVILPPHDASELPLTVLYKGGEEVVAADRNELIGELFIKAFE